MISLNKSEEFYKRLAKLPREELLELIGMQDPELLEQVFYIEKVFSTRLSHLTWPDGTPITERLFTQEELAYIIDEPFEVNSELTKIGLNIQDQKNLHYSKDSILWAKYFLKIKPRVYQILMIRYPKRFKVLRSGRRAGKTFSLAVLSIHHAWTTNNGRILIVTPVKAQGGLIYEEIMKLVKKSDIVFESVTRNVTSPQYEINLTNGSTIRFFTSGVKTGDKADITRGQEAQLIILDEMDYMGDDDLDALLAMLQQTEENQAPKRLIGASTPTGRRGTFWKWCNQNRFREFYFPSYCNPHWSNEDEEFYREEYTETGYRHEIEADWGEDAEGVYPRKYLDAAFKHPGWDYLPFPENPDSIYVVGVDWDKYGAGVNIVVLEMVNAKRGDKSRSKVRLAYREETIREEYTLIKAVERVIYLDSIFNFAHLYIDRGYGEVQFELIKQHGVQNPHTGLETRVRGVAFNEMIEVRDPHTFAKIKKEIKPFMVDNLRQMFERGQMAIPGNDEELYMQLLSYIVSRTTVTGKPVFEISTKGVYDHAHDALILAALAISENYGDLMHLNYAIQSHVISNEAFLSTLELSSDPATRQQEKEIIEDKWGTASAAPVQVRRDMTYNRRKGSRPFSRKMF